MLTDKFKNCIQNKYLVWYINIIENALKEERIYNSSIHEMHHAFPKSFGGDESSLNYVPLTFKEHYICHLLLTKFTIGKDKMKMCFALHTFFHFDLHRKLKLYRGKTYESHKRMFIQACKEREPWVKLEIFKFKHLDTQEEFIGTRSEFRQHSGLTSQEIYNLLQKGSVMLHAKRWGVYRESEEMFSFERVTVHKKPQNKECEHCKKILSPQNYKRYHGERCKKFDKEAYSKAIMQISNLQKKLKLNRDL